MDSKTHHTIQNTPFYLIILASISHRHSKIPALCISPLYFHQYSFVFNSRNSFYLIFICKKCSNPDLQIEHLCCKDKKFVILRTPRIHGVSSCTAVDIDHFFDVTDVTPRRGNRWGLKFEKHYGNLVIHSMQKGERKVWDQSKCSRRSPLKASKK